MAKRHGVRRHPFRLAAIGFAQPKRSREKKKKGPTMKLIHKLNRTVSLVVLSLAMLIAPLQVAANRHPAKPDRRKPIEKRRQSNNAGRADRRRAEARRRADAARLAAAARERAAEEAMREQVQAMIAKDDVSGEDPEIRRIAVNALGDHAGTVVVMNPKTGRVYSIVNQQWALREGFKPCSTIKLVTGLAGLNEKVIDPSNTIAISDSNRIDLTHALAHSNNEYFQQVGGQVGFSKMISYARLMGLGEKTGINARNEYAGQVPTSKTGFAVNHMSSHGDDFKVTALQLATLVSTMANGGKLVTPFFARTAQDEKRSTAKVRRTVKIDSESFQLMVPGMIGSVSYGSGKRAFDPQAIVAGKTGTCIDHGTWVGLFTSYAPLNDPQIAIAVIARGTDGRNHFPAAVAGRIYRDLNSRFGASGNLEIASKLPAIPATSAADTNTDVDEEEADAKDLADDSSSRQLDSNKPVWGDQRKAVQSKMKRTVMTLPSQPTQPAINNSPSQRARRVGGQ